MNSPLRPASFPPQQHGISDTMFETLAASGREVAGRSARELHDRFDYLMVEYQRMASNEADEAPWNEWEDRVLLEHCQSHGHSRAAFRAVSAKLENHRTAPQLKKRFKVLMRLYLESMDAEYDSDAFATSSEEEES